MNCEEREAISEIIGQLEYAWALTVESAHAIDGIRHCEAAVTTRTGLKRTGSALENAATAIGRTIYDLEEMRGWK